jgi:hypothetical protein
MTQNEDKQNNPLIGHKTQNEDKQNNPAYWAQDTERRQAKQSAY